MSNPIYLHERTIDESLQIYFSNNKIYKSQYYKLNKEIQYLSATINTINHNSNNWLIVTTNKPDKILITITIEFTQLLKLIALLKKQGIKKVLALKSLQASKNFIESINTSLDYAYKNNLATFSKSTKRKYLQKIKNYNKKINNLELDLSFHQTEIIYYYLEIKKNLLLWYTGPQQKNTPQQKDIQELKNICEVQIVSNFIKSSITFSNL